MSRSHLLPNSLARAAAAILALAILAAACSPVPAQQPGTPTQPSAPPTATPGTPATQPLHPGRDLSPDAAPAHLAALAFGNSRFAFDLYGVLRQEDGNLFYSPFSISQALAMAYAGARGETQAQMARALHFALAQGDLHPAFNALDLALASQEEFILTSANGLWGQHGYPIRREYLETLARHYGAALRLADFTGDASREQARQEINQWVSDQTADRIPELIAPDILTAYTRLVLVNAIYFYGEWQEPFPAENTQAAPFYRLDGSQVSVQMMARRGVMAYVDGGEYQALELAYKGGHVRMLVLVPAEGQFEAVERRLDTGLLAEVRAALRPDDVRLYLPKFSYEAEFMLADILAAMGMPDAFDEDRADFSGAVDIPPRLFISHVVHKAFVAVDEAGTEAAAATGIVAEIVSEPRHVRVDRPFIFFIHDTHTDSVLFVGRVLDPR
jgi:serpin B